MTQPNQQGLKKVLRPVHLWGIAVALVISGEYFGWNYGWAKAGTVGFLIATVLITLFYITFIFSYTELSTAIPNAGGAFAYAYRALGPIGGLIAGYATLIDFVLATPAIGASLGAYVHFLYPAIPALYVALAFYLLFTVLNIIGVKESAVFTVIITVLSVGELLLFMGIIGPHFKSENFLANGMPHGWPGVFAALPFAIWFYLAIEGVATVAEEVKNPNRDIPKGYIAGIATLALLAVSVSVLTGGIGNWQQLSAIDYPLPEAIGLVLGKTSGLTKLFAGIGLFGLIASFHGTILASSRQLFAMGRAGYLPKFLSTISTKFKTPHWATITASLVGCMVLLLFDTQQTIVLSTMGAVLMYLMSMVSLFVLRKKEPAMERPFKSPFYPWFPIIALALGVVCLVAFVCYYLTLTLVFSAGLAVALLLFVLTGRHKGQPVEAL